MKIINCHIHTFTDQDVPDKFLPLGLVRWIAKKDHPVLNWIMHNLNPFTDNDIYDRYQEFITTGRLGSQQLIFKKCQDNYPAGTQFIVLPMDLEFMGAGNIPRTYDAQLQELATLPEEVIKFIHIDPRRSNAIELFRYYITTRGFRGLKLYPPIGYFPYDEVLMPIYQFCQDNKIPVISHGSPMGPVYFKGSRIELKRLLNGIEYSDDWTKSNQELCSRFVHPSNFLHPIQAFPEVNFCIAHFGSDHWEKFLQGDKSDDNWVNLIINMINKFPNVWTDISFTMYNEKYWPLLKLLLNQDFKIANRVLFGSDYYVNETVATEREWSIKLRAYLGESLFSQIAEVNPLVFFKESRKSCTCSGCI